MASAKSISTRFSFARVISQLRTLVAKRSHYRRTVRQLNVLSERDLHDIGISRSDIHSIARASF